MHSRNRSIVRMLDTQDRPSTGIKYPPLIPVDGEELMQGSRTSSAPPTSVELLRQLEACVRELLEMNSKK
jgi:hypothetical protein